MNWKNLIFSGMFFAGSLHGSILVLSNGLASPAFIQDFSSPALSAGNKTGTNGASVTNQFSNVTVSAGNAGTTATTGLFYDPDGAAGCAVVFSGGTAITNMPANCVGNFTNSSSLGQGSLTVANDPGGNPYAGPNGLPTINLGFVTGQTSVAFVLATAANGTNSQGQYPNNTLVQVYDKNGNLIDSQAIHTSFTAGANGTNGTNWVTISEATTIGSVVLSSTGMDETGQNGANGVTPTPWAAQLSNVEGNVMTSSTPEPATMALFGFGLVGVGLLVRRRKS